MNMQAQARAVLDRLIPDDAEIILLDYPNTTNVGDSLIWLGEMAYLKSRKLKIVYVCDTRNYDLAKIKALINRKSMVLMHGGGNFGTVWQEIQTFRLNVLRDLANTPIIQLPQTIHFDDPVKIEEMNAAISQHGAYTLLVRSASCEAFALQHFGCTTKLCPDMAFFIGAIHSWNRAAVDRLVVARTDHEASATLGNGTYCFASHLRYRVVDWLDASLLERLLHRVEMHTVWLRAKLDPNNTALLVLWNMLSELRLQRGIQLLTQGKLIITDRLHVHILSILLGKPHVIVDNNYGKLKHFFATWTCNNLFSRHLTNPLQLNQVSHELAELAYHEQSAN
ncbi:MAG TPA: polysaccharide pyruvyl transferase family protein [Methylophilus sp.]